MSAALLAPASLAGYAVSEILYGWYLCQRRARVGQAASVCFLIALALHYFALLARARPPHTVPYHDLWGSLSLLAWLLALVYLGLELRYHDRAVGAFLVLFVLLLQGTAVLLAPEALVEPAGSPRGTLFAFHIAITMLAYAAFGLSFILSSLFLLEQRFLQTHTLGRLFWRLPPLELLERMSRAAVQVGLVALSIGLTAGFLTARSQHGTLWSGDPKEIWSLLVWGVYAAYLYLQARAGWQGRRASLLSIGAFAVVVFGYTVVNLYLTKYHSFY